MRGFRCSRSGSVSPPVSSIDRHSVVSLSKLIRGFSRGILGDLAAYYIVPPRVPSKWQGYGLDMAYRAGYEQGIDDARSIVRNRANGGEGVMSR